MAPSLTPSRLPTPTTSTRHPTPNIDGLFCDHRIFQGLLSDLSSCLDTGSPCCAQYNSFFSCSFTGQFDAYALSQFRLSCRQTCSLSECHSKAVSTTTSTTTQEVLTLPPIIPTIDSHECSFNMLTSYQSELMDLATCLSGTHTISVHEGSSCCPRYHAILTSVCRLRLDSSHIDEIRSTCSTICRDHHCPNDNQIDAVVTESVRLNGDFESIVAPDKNNFLNECSAHLSPIHCIDARSGSIIIDLQGPSNEVRSHIEKIEADGIQLPSYPALEMLPSEEGKEQQDASVNAGVGIMVALLCLFVCCCCMGSYYYCVFGDEGFGKSSRIAFDEGSKTIEIQQPHSMEGIGERTLREVDLESMF